MFAHHINNREMKKITTILIVCMTLLISCEEDDILSYEEQLTIDIEKIEQYLTDNNLTALKTTSGLYYIIEEQGDGYDYPNYNATVIIKYTGKLLNGEVFESNTTDPTPLFGFIQGWQEGIPKFKKGGSGKLIIPSGLGYGTKGQGSIPGNTVLIFDIKLLAFEN